MNGPCNDNPSFGGGFDEACAATIIPPTAGKYRDAGTGSLSAFGAAEGTLTQTFTPAQTATTPIAPTSAQQRKNNGYRRFGGLFTNQGDCVSFVATGSKNRLSGA